MYELLSAREWNLESKIMFPRLHVVRRIGCSVQKLERMMSSVPSCQKGIFIYLFINFLIVLLCFDNDMGTKIDL